MQRLASHIQRTSVRLGRRDGQTMIEGAFSIFLLMVCLIAISVVGTVILANTTLVNYTVTAAQSALVADHRLSFSSAVDTAPNRAAAQAAAQTAANDTFNSLSADTHLLRLLQLRDGGCDGRQTIAANVDVAHDEVAHTVTVTTTSSAYWAGFGLFQRCMSAQATVTGRNG